MRSCSTMCFSSSLICLLVVTCHGSVINSYHAELENQEHKDGSRSNDTSSILSRNLLKHNLTASDYVPSITPASYPSNFTNHQELVQNHGTESQVATPTRIKRATEDELELPLPRRIGEINQVNPRNLPPSSESQPGHHNHLHHHLNESHDESDVESHAHESHDHDHHDKQPIMNSHLPLKSSPGNGKTKSTNNHGCHDDWHGEEHNATDDTEANKNNSHQGIPGRVWLYACAAVVAISLCGLLSVALIPIMQKWFYQTLLQFLVGLAVGSLSGDGLLHLMPHAILSGEDSHDHSNSGSHHHTSGATLQAMEINAIWRGLAALTGIFLFFVAERLLGALTSYRRKQKEARLSIRSKNLVSIPRDEGTNNGSVGEKLALPKKNSYDNIKEKDEKETMLQETEASPSKKGSNQSVHEIGFHGRSSFSMEPDAMVAYRPDSDNSVIISDHHGHSHGHSHDIPQSVSAVAWMVIMGDGLHNFCDGLAIGAAFASSEADGISTTVAVFCHELPHELGDFAMLLKTGMKVKQALFYNGLSSVLCFLGMVIGVSLGNVHSATNWIFAGTAGMFLYIALVDMLPELSVPADNPKSLVVTTVVQVLGIMIGICVMLLIALYEHELRTIVS